MSTWARVHFVIVAHVLLSVAAEGAAAAPAAGPPAATPSGRGIQGDIELLTKTAAALKANIDRLQTWQAEVVEDTREIGRPLGPIHWKYSTSFVYDRPRDAVRWEWRVMPTWDWPLKFGPAQRWRTRGMIIDKAVYHLGTMPIDQRPKSATLHIQQAKRIPDTRGDITFEFHPMAFIYEKPEKTYEMLLWYRKNAERLSNTKITSEGTRVIMEVGGKALVNRYTFDLAAGGNVVEYLTTTPGERYAYTFTFEAISGAFVPKAAGRQTSRLVAGVRVECREAASFKTIAVNEPLDKDEFTVQKMGVQKGDRVQDDIKGVNYVLSK